MRAPLTLEFQCPTAAVSANSEAAEFGRRHILYLMNRQRHGDDPLT